MGEVILGLPGPWADIKSEVSDHYTTKIGGPTDLPIPHVTVKPDLLLCDACGNNLALVAQVYAPITSSVFKNEERAIYVFGCVVRKCASSPVSWKTFRVQKLLGDENSNAMCREVFPSIIYPQPALASKSVKDLWTFDSIEDDDDIDLEELSKAFSVAATLGSHPEKQSNSSAREPTLEPSKLIRTTRVISDNVPGHEMAIQPSCLVSTYICRKRHFLKGSTSRNKNCSSPFLKENSNNTDDSFPEETWEGESYEYDRALNSDRIYLKFKKRMDVYPDQCFRYSYGGKPLLATGGLADPGICKLCGGSKHYEMQLMPPLLYFLQEKGLDRKDHSMDNWIWMTLIVYTCVANCTDSNPNKSGGWIFAEEEIVMQYE